VRPEDSVVTTLALDTLAAWSGIVMFAGLAYLVTGILRATLTCVVPKDGSS
jgi:hypothetical protein